jgi:2-hydroxychromene-2-carboxylate isomerase
VEILEAHERQAAQVQEEWDEWKQAKWLQLDQYYNQGMFGDPTFVKDHSQVFQLVWTYMVKDLNACKKARMACDGSTRNGKA